MEVEAYSASKLTRLTHARVKRDKDVDSIPLSILEFKQGIRGSVRKPSADMARTVPISRSRVASLSVRLGSGANINCANGDTCKRWVGSFGW